RVYVDNVREVFDVGQDQIFFVSGRRLDRRVERYPLHARVALTEELVGPTLNPPSHVGVGGAAAGGGVLAAAILGRVVRRRDDDAVGQVFLAATVVDEDGPRDDRRRRDAGVALDDRLDPVRRQHFEGGPLSRLGERVRVLSHVERAVDAL